ncbi:hypothetical protein [Chromobacterium phragmitis]|uniref:hypothetical protein n=1 Tax=Chromobacterium phragmitis TaxID=2202141 RepID=UPI003D3657DF
MLDPLATGLLPVCLGEATKFYEAVRGNGGTARLVMLPHEPHPFGAPRRLRRNRRLRLRAAAVRARARRAASAAGTTTRRAAAV